MWSLADAGIFARDIAAVSAVLFGVYRYGVRPRVVVPIQDFAVEVREALVSVKRLEPQVTEMRAALGPNGGKSLADVIHRTAGRLNLMVDGLKTPTWEASMDGANMRVNPAFEVAFGYSAAELRGHGWKNLLHTDDAAKYFEAWESAVHDVRVFHFRGARFVTKSGLDVAVDVSASPASYGVQSASHLWMGTVYIRDQA